MRTTGGAVMKEEEEEEEGGRKGGGRGAGRVADKGEAGKGVMHDADQVGW